MCNAYQGAAAGAQAVAARQAAKAQKATLLYDAQVSENNATLAGWQADDAVAQGQRDEQTIRTQTAVIKSSQRAAMAANGIDVNAAGTAVDVQTSTDYMGEVDALTARDNALKTAWGYRTQGVNYKDNARNTRAGAGQIRPGVSAALSLLGSAGTWAGSKGGS